MKKKIYVCPNCGRALNFSEDAEYTFYCGDCGDYFHDYEAKTEEQARIEGIKDYTELAEVAMEIDTITDKAIQASNKRIEIKGKDIVEQIIEYIAATINPILSSGIYKNSKFRDCARIYSSNLQISFGDYGGTASGYQAQLFGYNGALRVYFNANGKCLVEEDGSRIIRTIVEEWPRLKDSMNRMIPYAIDECNKANQKKIEKQQEREQIINSFRL
jgi:hypothetical protein